MELISNPHSTPTLFVVPPTVRQPQSNASQPMPTGGVYTYADLLNAEPRPITFVLQGLIAEGQVSILGGPYAIGKTMLTLQFGQHLAIGRSFMGRAIPRPYRTAFIDTENGRQEITSRLRDQAESFVPGLDKQETRLLSTNWVYVDSSDEGPLQCLQLNRNGFAALTQFVNQQNIEAIIIDNFGRVFPGKETDDKDLRAFFTDLKRLQNQAPQLAMVLFLNHVTKPPIDGHTPPDLLTEPYQWLSRVRGSGRILDFSEVRLGFDSQQTASGETYYVLNGIVRSGQAVPLVLERAVNGKAFQVHSDKALVVERLFRRSDRRRELYQSLPRGRDFSFTECCQLERNDGKPFCKQTVTETLAACVLNGLITKTSAGSYRCL